MIRALLVATLVPLLASAEEPQPIVLSTFGTSRFRGQQGFDGLGFLDGGKTVFAWGRGTPTMFWDAVTGKSRGELDASEGPVVVSPDGRLFAKAVNYDVDVMDLSGDGDTLKLKHLGKNFGPVYSIVFSPDGSRIALCDSANPVQVRSLVDGEVLKEFPIDAACCPAASWSADGSLFFHGQKSGKIVVRDAKTWKTVRSFEIPGNYRWEFDVSPDGGILFVPRRDGDADAWNPRTGEAFADLAKAASNVRSAAFSPDGKLLATSGDSKLEVIEVPTGRKLLDLGRARCSAVRFSPDGKVLWGVAGCGVRRWDARSGKPLDADPADFVRMASIHWSGDGEALSGPGPEGTLVTWDAASGRATRTVQTPEDWVSSVAWSPDDRFAAVPSRRKRGVMDILELASGRLLREEHAFAGAFTPGGTFAAGQEKGISFSEPGSGRTVDDLPCEDFDLLAALDDDRVALMDESGIRVVSRKTRETTFSLKRDDGEFAGAAFTPDGRNLVVSREQAGVEAWDVEGNRLLWKNRSLVVAEDLGDFSFASTSRDGRLVAVASGSLREGYTLDIIELATGRRFLRVRPGNSWLWSFEISPEGRRVAVGMRNGTAQVLSLQPEEDEGGASRRLADVAADLASDEGAKAWRAIWKLGTGNQAAVEAALAASDALPDDTAARAAISHLGDDDATSRQGAKDELRNLGPDAEPALRAALGKSPGAEEKAALEELLANAASGNSATTSSLRISRAIWALEMNASPGARKALGRLAESHFSARGRSEATKALARLSR